MGPGRRHHRPFQKTAVQMCQIIGAAAAACRRRVAFRIRIFVGDEHRSVGIEDVVGVRRTDEQKAKGVHERQCAGNPDDFGQKSHLISISKQINNRTAQHENKSNWLVILDTSGIHSYEISGLIYRCRALFMKKITFLNDYTPSFLKWSGFKQSAHARDHEISCGSFRND
uniref:Uncharacterized protein n=1 Tax=Romanomermis culicivorax TaxID=13658 RepID=A0A915K5C9_ROMCU